MVRSHTLDHIPFLLHLLVPDHTLRRTRLRSSRHSGDRELGVRRPGCGRIAGRSLGEGAVVWQHSWSFRLSYSGGS